MVDMLDDFGLSADQIDIQSEHIDEYQLPLHRLAKEGHIYFCNCSRARLKASAKRGPDGSFIYDNQCREKRWSPGQSLQEGSLRCRLPEVRYVLKDRLVSSRAYETNEHFGDPVILRRDGAFSYHFSSVVDDARVGVTDVIRGRDLIDSTPTQVVLRNLLGLPIPTYYHHLLLMEGSKKKLAKLHGSIAVRHLRRNLSAEAILGYLGYFMGLVEDTKPLSLTDLQKEFCWERISRNDVLVHFNEDTAELVSQNL